MKIIVLALAAVLASTPAIADTCTTMSTVERCIFDPGERIFADNESLLAYLTLHALDYVGSSPVDTYPNETGMALGTPSWLFYSSPLQTYYIFARRDPDGAIEVIATIHAPKGA